MARATEQYIVMSQPLSLSPTTAVALQLYIKTRNIDQQLPAPASRFISRRSYYFPPRTNTGIRDGRPLSGSCGSILIRSRCGGRDGREAQSRPQDISRRDDQVLCASCGFNVLHQRSVDWPKGAFTHGCLRSKGKVADSEPRFQCTLQCYVHYRSHFEACRILAICSRNNLPPYLNRLWQRVTDHPNCQFSLLRSRRPHTNVKLWSL